MGQQGIQGIKGGTWQRIEGIKGDTGPKKFKEYMAMLDNKKFKV
jgi:hypothetical protein